MRRAKGGGVVVGEGQTRCGEVKKRVNLRDQCRASRRGELELEDEPDDKCPSCETELRSQHKRAETAALDGRSFFMRSTPKLAKDRAALTSAITRNPSPRTRNPSLHSPFHGHPQSRASRHSSPFDSPREASSLRIGGSWLPGESEALS